MYLLTIHALILYHSFFKVFTNLKIPKKTAKLPTILSENVIQKFSSATIDNKAIPNKMMIIAFIIFNL